MASFSLQFHYLLIQTVYAVKLLERHSDVGIKKFSYVLLALSPCVLIQKYICVWPRTRTLGLGLGLVVLGSTLASRVLALTFWLRLTSLLRQWTLIDGPIAAVYRTLQSVTGQSSCCRWAMGQLALQHSLCVCLSLCPSLPPSFSLLLPLCLVSRTILESQYQNAKPFWVS